MVRLTRFFNLACQEKFSASQCLMRHGAFRLATIIKLKSGSWRVQVRRKGKYVSETFLRRKDAEEWATDIEGRINRHQPVATWKSHRNPLFSDLITLHRKDSKEVGKRFGRSRLRSARRANKRQSTTSIGARQRLLLMNAPNGTPKTQKFTPSLQHAPVGAWPESGVSENCRLISDYGGALSPNQRGDRLGTPLSLQTQPQQRRPTNTAFRPKGPAPALVQSHTPKNRG